MFPGRTLFGYIARQFLGWCGGVFVALLSIVFLLDYVELIRRAGERPDATLLVLLEMATLKQPQMAQQIMPFVILFGTMMAFWRLTRSNELVVARAAGVSVWQFLAPPLAGAVFIGVLMITLFNPIASIMQASYERLEDRIMRNNDERLELLRTGLWLRQSDGSGVQSIVHADRYIAKDNSLRGVMFLFIADDRTLSRRIDASQAQLTDGEWQVEDGSVWRPDRVPEHFDKRRRPHQSHAAQDPGQLRLAGNDVVLGAAELHPSARELGFPGAAPSALFRFAAGPPAALCGHGADRRGLQPAHAAARRHRRHDRRRRRLRFCPVLPFGRGVRSRSFRDHSACARGLDTGRRQRASRCESPAASGGRLSPDAPRGGHVLVSPRP